MRPEDNLAAMTTTSSPMLGSRLYYFRKLKDFSQEYMADRLGVTQSTYSRWESGEVVPKLDMLKQAAEILEVQEQQLLTSESFVLSQHNNTNVAGYIQNFNNYVPSEMVDKLMNQHAEHIKQLEALCNRLTDIIERTLSGK